jgi:hypothetical protein
MVLIGLITLAALSACSSTPGAGPTATAGPGSTATAAPGATPVPTAAATASASTALPAVDLTLSGPYSVVAKGTAGQCTPLKDSSGAIAFFGFGAVEADYPGLGQGLYFSEGKPGNVSVKWWVTATTGFFSMAEIKGVSTDHHSLTIDADLEGPSGTEHVKGTVSCP